MGNFSDIFWNNLADNFSGGHHVQLSSGSNGSHKIGKFVIYDYWGTRDFSLVSSKLILFHCECIVFYRVHPEILAEMVV